MPLFQSPFQFQCPACASTISLYDRPRRKHLGLLTEHLICPGCNATIGPDKGTRSLRMVLIVFVPLIFVVFAIMDYLDRVSTPGVVLMLGGLMLVAVVLFFRARWEVIEPGQTPAPGTPADPRATSVASAVARISPDMTFTFSFPKTQLLEHLVGIGIGLFCIVLFGYLYYQHETLVALVVLIMSLLMTPILLFRLWRPASVTRIEIDREGVRRIAGDKRQRISWNEVSEVRESGLFGGISLRNRRGTHIRLSYRLEQFPLLRELLMDNLRDYFLARQPARFWRRPWPFAVLFTMGVFPASVTIVLGEIGLVPAAVLLAFALVFLVLAARQVRAAVLDHGQLMLMRFLWKATTVPYAEIQALHIEENLESMFGFPNPHKGYTSPGVVIRTRRGSFALPLMNKGPMWLYLALQAKLRSR